MFAIQRSARMKSARSTKSRMIRRSHGTVMERKVRMTPTTQTIYQLNRLQLRATTPNSVMGKQGWVVQGRRMYATRWQT